MKTLVTFLSIWDSDFLKLVFYKKRERREYFLRVNAKPRLETDFFFKAEGLTFNVSADNGINLIGIGCEIPGGSGVNIQPGINYQFQAANKVTVVRIVRL